MSERIDHTEISELQISLAIRAAEDEEATSIVHAMLAQTRATLALVEQQRIANLIALHRHEVKYDIGEWSRLYDEESEDLKPDIREALGLS